MDNKQKIVNIILNELTIIGKTVSMDFDKITRKIDALYKRDCGKCKHFSGEMGCFSDAYCYRQSHGFKDNYEEADK